MIARFLFYCITLTAALALLLSGWEARADLEVPTDKPAAVIDLGTTEGVRLVNGEWRYSDTRIVAVDFRKPGSDGQPTGETIKTYDFMPHAGGVGFDDSRWEAIDPTTLNKRRATGRLCFNWYRINVTVPERI